MRRARKFPPEAVEIFRQMQQLEKACSCTRVRKCANCDKWWELHGQLHDMLGCKPWQWPCVEPPDAVYGPGCKPNADAMALYRRLDEAARASV